MENKWEWIGTRAFWDHQQITAVVPLQTGKLHFIYSLFQRE